MKTAVALMGFREDSAGRLHAAFRGAPVGTYLFELPAPRRLLGVSAEAQERWAHAAARTRGHAYAGLWVTDAR